MKETLLAVAGIGFLYLGMYLAGITCPILYLTGVSCAGCGMTRAWLHVLRLDFVSAFQYHPLWPLVLPAVVLWQGQLKIPPKLKKAIAYIGVISFLVVYAVRMADPADEIVRFRPQEGLAARILSEII